MAKAGRVCGWLGLLFAVVAFTANGAAIAMAIVAAQVEQNQSQPGYYDNLPQYDEA